MNLIEDCRRQADAVANYFDQLNTRMDRMAALVSYDWANEEKKHMEMAV
jgi:hypothetical protein